MVVILRSSRRPECLVCQQLGLVYVNLFPMNLISLTRPIGLHARRITLINHNALRSAEAGECYHRTADGETTLCVSGRELLGRTTLGALGALHPC